MVKMKASPESLIRRFEHPFPVGTKVVKTKGEDGDFHPAYSMGVVTKTFELPPEDAVEIFGEPCRHGYLVRFDGDSVDTFIAGVKVEPFHALKALFKHGPRVSKEGKIHG